MADSLLAQLPEPELLPLRFVLAGQEPHALSPGLAWGPTLCGLAEPAPGWVLFGFTRVDLDRIGCVDCRQVATRMADAQREGSAMLRGGRI